MDDLHVSLAVEAVAGTMSLPVAVELALLARFYERFGDHAVNLAKRVAVLARTSSTTGDSPATHRPDPAASTTTDPPGSQATIPRRTNDSAICTAFRAAPLRRLSPLTNSASA